MPHLQEQDAPSLWFPNFSITIPWRACYSTDYWASARVSGSVGLGQDLGTSISNIARLYGCCWSGDPTRNSLSALLLQTATLPSMDLTTGMLKGIVFGVVLAIVTLELGGQLDTEWNSLPALLKISRQAKPQNSALAPAGGIATHCYPPSCKGKSKPQGITGR